jgi:uncharacterized protein (DUF983 family)
VSEDAKKTVSRAAFFGGWIAGILIFGLGFWFVPRFALPGWASLPLEILTVAVALLVMTRIWKASAATSVDTTAGDRDRGD